MKLKYYLRGLGIGIVVTAAVMGILSSRSNISDAEIIERARALGMTESSVLSDLEQTEKSEEITQATTIQATEPEEQSEEASSEEVTSSENQTQSESLIEEETTVPEKTTAQEKTTTKETEVAEEKESANTLQNSTDEKIQIVIKSGESSDAVSLKLYEAGLVASATEYDKYLCANGYANKIAAGTHEIPTNATEEEIAKLLCNR